MTRTPHGEDTASRTNDGRSRGRAVVAGLVVAVTTVAVVALGLDGGPPPAVLPEDLDPRTVAFVVHHDRIAADLDRERARVAEKEPSAERLLDLVGMLESAHQQHAARQAPAWLEADVTAYLAAIEAERNALSEAHNAMQSGTDPRAALQRVLDARTHADNLAAALRGTAIMHPAGRG